MLTHPTGLFTGDYILTPKGVLASQIIDTPTSPIKSISSQTRGAGWPQVGLCPIFLVKMFSMCHILTQCMEHIRDFIQMIVCYVNVQLIINNNNNNETEYASLWKKTWMNGERQQ